MSYEKHVYPAVLPSDLLERWRAKMLDLGLDVELDPSFDPHTWGGGFLPFKVRIAPHQEALVGRYGGVPIRAGFELQAVLDAEEKADILREYAEDMEASGRPLPSDLLARLERAPAIFGFTHGGFSWSVADFRLCWVAAASLAEVTGGHLFDEWTNENCGFLTAAQAARVALERAEQYEASQAADSPAWQLPEFSGW